MLQFLYCQPRFSPVYPYGNIHTLCVLERGSPPQGIKKGDCHMNENRIELNEETLENVVGGTSRTVRTGVDGLNAAVRLAPAKDSKQIASLPNGTIVNTISDELVYDPVAGRNFVEITFTYRGEQKTGWMASSILGLKR